MSLILTVNRQGRQCIYFTKYHSFLNLYTHSDFLKMLMHNAWLLGKTDLTISLPNEFFTEPKYVYIFCGTMKLSAICENSDAKNFDFHTLLFASTYLMVDDAFILKLLKTSGDVSFHSNTILPSLYATNFVSSIRDLP